MEGRLIEASAEISKTNAANEFWGYLSGAKTVPSHFHIKDAVLIGYRILTFRRHVFKSRNVLDVRLKISADAEGNPLKITMCVDKEQDGKTISVENVTSCGPGHVIGRTMTGL